ncbi:MAG: hypothetical protein NXI13_16410 [Proteobacteria bacterium]|nr:hypothetical protein [Pseudomonadota bacterium]
MANRHLTADIIAKAAVAILDNELVMGKKVFRGYEDEFNKNINGYTVGDTITIERPTDFTVRDGATASAQDVSEGKTSLTIDKQKGVDFAFTSKQLTLDIKELSRRVIKPAMIQLANQIDVDLHALYKDVPNWVGTPGQTINSFADYSLAAQRMDEYAVPQDMRCGVLSPADHWGLAGGAQTLYNDTLNKPAYREGEIGKIATFDTYMTQNTATHTVGAHAGTPLTNGAAQGTTWDASRDTNTQTLITDGWTSGAVTLNAGDVFTIADVYAVNPVTKETLDFLKEFTVVNTISDTAGAITLTMSPAAIPSGAQQTVSADIGDNKAIVVKGTASTAYRQNMVFHKNAFTLATVPMVAPPGAVEVGRQSYKGMNVRVIPGYNVTTDVSTYRLDVLYGVKTIDPRLAMRVSGTA